MTSFPSLANFLDRNVDFSICATSEYIINRCRAFIPTFYFIILFSEKYYVSIVTYPTISLPPPSLSILFPRSVCISVKNTHNKCPRGNTFIRPLTTGFCSFSRVHSHFHLLLNYSYFSTADAPFAGADAAGVSSEMRLSSRFPIVFYHRLATRRYPTTIDRPTKKRPLLSSPVDWVKVVDTTVAKQTPKNEIILW